MSRCMYRGHHVVSSCIFLFPLSLHIVQSHKAISQRFFWHPLVCTVCHSNLQFYEWKWADRGRVLSWHRPPTLFALWSDVHPFFTHEKTELEKAFSFVSFSRFQTFQFHWGIFNSIVCILMSGVQWALWFVTSLWSDCLSEQWCRQALCVVSGEASANFERPSRSNFFLDFRRQAMLV